MTLVLVAMALLVSRSGWTVPLIGDAERALYDLRLVSQAPRVDQDDRILMIVYTDDTLIETRKRSPLDRGLLAQALGNLDTMGAKAIGIDILFDQPQDEDGTLVERFQAMRTPTRIAYAETSANPDSIQFRQQQFLDSFVARLKGSRVSPASIRLDVDSDGVARSWPIPRMGLPTALTPAIAPGAPHFEHYSGSIRYRLPTNPDRPVFASLPIDLFADSGTAAAFADQVRGRYVLIGGDIVDVDQFETPVTSAIGKTMIGMEVHANLLAQRLDNAALPRVPGWIQWILALLAVAGGAAASLADRFDWRLALLLMLMLMFFLALPFVAQGRGFDTQSLSAVGWILGFVITFSAVGSAAKGVGSAQRDFAQNALGRYLPRDIAKEILDDPERLALHGERRAIFVVFSDLEGFTTLSHALQPEQVARLLNRYLDLLSAVVLDHGGTLDKFVGDAVVAFWGAPIARADDGERAALAAHAMWEAGERFRAEASTDLPPVGKTRVGLHYGEAIVGNFGGEGRIQYTALGDAMNTASRLEAANKQIGSNVLVSREAMERSGLDWWRPLGRVELRGRSTPVDLFTPCPGEMAGDAALLASMLERIRSGDESARAELAQHVNQHPDDALLRKLLYRVDNDNGGGAYALS